MGEQQGRGAFDRDQALALGGLALAVGILVDNANYITLMQPIYRVAVHKNIKDVKLTPNVWKMELAQIKPAS